MFVFIFFGLVAVGTTFFVQAGFPSLDVWLVASAVGLLSTNLLVANNYRDRVGDAAVGKRTLVVILGERAARLQYWGSTAIALSVPVVLFSTGHSLWVLLPLIAVPAGVWNAFSLRPDASAPELIRVLGRTAAFLLLYGVLLSTGLILS